MKRFLGLLLLAVMILPLGQGLAAKKINNLEAALAIVAASPAEADIREYPLTGEELAELTAAYPDTKLKYSVSIYGHVFDGDASVIDFGDAVLRKIKEVKAALPFLPKLAEAHMYACNFSRADMEVLWSLRPEVHWGWTLKMGNYMIRTDIEAFSTLHAARSNRHTTAYYDALKYCWQLKALDLGHNKITDIGFIGLIKGLRVLILADNRIKDISPLAELDQLQYVELFMNYITDLSPLAGAPELLDLNLCHGSFVNIDPVLTMPKLERLWVTKHKNTPEGYLESIGERLPGVEFYIDGTGSTGGTWREHERFAIIREMFKTFTYIPFPESK